MANDSLHEARSSAPTIKLSASDVRALARQSSSSLIEVLDQRYELRRHLGTGGCGDVYAAWDRLLKRFVTVKRLRPDATDPQARERFRREAVTLAEVDCDRVVRILDFRITRDDCYQVLEYIPGRSLDVEVEVRGPLPAPHALRVARDVLQGLAQLHALDITHRDIKPGNVLIGDDGRATLLDLGTARTPRRRPITPVTHTIGTPIYMAPEQRRSSHVDGRTDLYQLGLLLLYAVTAIEAETDDEILLALERVDPRITDVVTRALAPLEERFQSANEMLAVVEAAMRTTIEVGIDEILSATPIPVELVAPPSPSRESKKRRRRVAAAGAALAIATGALLFVLAPGANDMLVPAAAAQELTEEPMPAIDLALHEPASIASEPMTSVSVTSTPVPEARRTVDRTPRQPVQADTTNTHWRSKSRHEKLRGARSQPAAATIEVGAGGSSEADALLRAALAYEQNEAPELAISALRAFLRVEGAGTRADRARAKLAALERCRLERRGC